MALSKLIDADTGVPAVYWRIVRVDADLKVRAVWFVVDGYISQQAREAGREPIMQKPMTLPMPEDAEPESYTRATLYAYVKGLEAFAGAVDA